MRATRVDSPRHSLGLEATTLALAEVLSALVFASSAVAVTFNPNLVISDDNMRAYDNYSAADIQAFLVSNGSALATRSFRRHDRGRTAPASTIIYEAARAHRMSPKVLLVMLQKEQSLITYAGQRSGFARLQVRLGGRHGRSGRLAAQPEVPGIRQPAVVRGAAA